MQLIPYLNFQGNTEEILNFYKEALMGQITSIMRYGEGPGMDVNEDYNNKVLHAELTFGDNTLYFSDTYPGTLVTIGNAISFNINFQDEVLMNQTYAALSVGGKDLSPIKEEFWGAKFGSLTDQYGIAWSFNMQLT